MYEKKCSALLMNFAVIVEERNVTEDGTAYRGKKALCLDGRNGICTMMGLF
jgi:hypothetical protein